MYCINDFSKNYIYDPVRNLGFNKYLNKTAKSNSLLTCGIIDNGLFKFLRDDTQIIHFEAEEPNCFFYPEFYLPKLEIEQRLNHVFTICPYTADWLNAIQRVNKRTACFFPVDKARAPEYVEPKDKQYDVIYTGHLIARSIEYFISPLLNFNYAWVSGSRDHRVTHNSISYDEKLKLVANSKVSVIHNLLWINERYFNNIKLFPNWSANGAFSHLAANLEDRSNNTVPQLKSRLFEAAFCGSLILCQADRWNLIEHWFKPNEHFLYFDHNNYHIILDEVIGNYSRYAPIAFNAREHAIKEYSTEAFVIKYLNRIDGSN